MERSIGVVWALEPTRSITLGAKHMIVNHEVACPEFFGALCEGLNCTGVRSDFVVRDDDTKFHTEGLHIKWLLPAAGAAATSTTAATSTSATATA